MAKRLTLVAIAAKFFIMSSPRHHGTDILTPDIMTENARRLTAYFLAATGDYHLAKDLFQETCRNAMHSIEHYDPDRPIGAWLRGIASHVLINHFRQSKRNPL